MTTSPTKDALKEERHRDCFKKCLALFPDMKRSAGVQANRAIRTSKLNALLRLHTWPIDVVVFHGSRRDLVLRRVSRLDAFSGYPVRT